MTAAPDIGPEAGLLARLTASRAGRFGILLLRWGIPAALLVIIGRRLTELGWREIWTARPANPGFYLLLVAQFFLQPFGDYFVYRNLWGGTSTPPMSVILRKRLMNTFMLDYSGEAYFYLWAQRRLKLAPGLLMLLLTGGLALPAVVGAHAWLYALVGTVPLLLCLALVLGHRKFTALSRRQIASTFGIHFTRSLLVLAVEFGLWQLSGALPSAVACLQFVALRLVVTRLPLVPNKDLIFVGAGIAAAGLAKVSVTPVAMVLVILAAADLILAATVASLAWLVDARRERGR
jgi:hypothetical protein